MHRESIGERIGERIGEFTASSPNGLRDAPPFISLSQI